MGMEVKTHLVTSIVEANITLLEVAIIAMVVGLGIEPRGGNNGEIKVVIEMDIIQIETGLILLGTKISNGIMTFGRKIKLVTNH